MSRSPPDLAFPRGALFGAAALIGFALVAAGVSRLTSEGRTRPTAAVVAERDLRFDDRADGTIVVTDARDGQPVESLAPGTNGFIRGSLRSLATRRKLNGDPDQTWHLVAWADGRLTLDDRESGGVIDLEAFGQTNEMAFARLLPGAKGTQ